VNADKSSKILVIKSDISELGTVEDMVHEIFKSNEIPDKYFNKVFLCLSEAIVNSIQHGNCNDKNKEVTIFAYCNSQMINIKIKDEGKGFDFYKVADPTLKENIKKESGRGIHIIRSLADSISYDKAEKSIQFKIECK
jgi:serine/threonine-protein kinase RsbW